MPDLISWPAQFQPPALVFIQLGLNGKEKQNNNAYKL